MRGALVAAEARAAAADALQEQADAQRDAARAHERRCAELEAMLERAEARAQVCSPAVFVRRVLKP
jgi:hypothetical protein